MYSGGVVVHYPGSLGAAVAILTTEFFCSDGIFAKQTFERTEGIHHFDRVMSHSFKCTLSCADHCDTKVTAQRWATSAIAIFHTGCPFCSPTASRVTLRQTRFA